MITRSKWSLPDSGTVTSIRFFSLRKKSPRVTVCGTCEEDAEARKRVSCFDSFLDEIDGHPGNLCTASVLDTAEALLQLQAAARTE